MLAPLLHAAAVARECMSEFVRWLDARDFAGAIGILKGAGALAAADQPEGDATCGASTAQVSARLMKRRAARVHDHAVGGADRGSTTAGWPTARARTLRRWSPRRRRRRRASSSPDARRRPRTR